MKDQVLVRITLGILAYNEQPPSLDIVLNRRELGEDLLIPILQRLERLVPFRRLRNAPNGRWSLRCERIMRCWNGLERFR